MAGFSLRKNWWMLLLPRPFLAERFCLVPGCRRALWRFEKLRFWICWIHALDWRVRKCPKKLRGWPGDPCWREVREF